MNEKLHVKKKILDGVERGLTDRHHWPSSDKPLEYGNNFTDVVTWLLKCCFGYCSIKKGMVVTKNLCIPYVVPSIFFSSYLHRK